MKRVNVSPHLLQKTFSLGSASRGPSPSLAEETPVSSSSSSSSFPSANNQPTPRFEEGRGAGKSLSHILTAHHFCTFLLTYYNKFLLISICMRVVDEESAPDACDDLSPVSNPTISLLSPRATQMAGLACV